MLRFISKLNDDLKDQLFILCSATSRYLATITAQLMLRNVVPNSFATPEVAYHSFIIKLFRQKFDNRRADQNLSAAAACRIYRRRRTGGGAHVCQPVTLSLDRQRSGISFPPNSSYMTTHIKLAWPNQTSKKSRLSSEYGRQILLV